jgi:hypothetical protein
VAAEATRKGRPPSTPRKIDLILNMLWVKKEPLQRERQKEILTREEAEKELSTCLFIHKFVHILLDSKNFEIFRCMGLFPLTLRFWGLHYLFEMLTLSRFVF